MSFPSTLAPTIGTDSDLPSAYVPDDPEGGVWRFGDFELDEACFELRHRGVRVALQPRVFDVLHLLVRRRARVVTREEMLRDVWRGASVCDSSIPRAVRALRLSLGERAGSGTTVETVRGRGYRFVAAVTGITWGIVRRDECAAARRRPPVSENEKEILRPLSGFSWECRSLLTMASVFGQAFCVPLLSAAARRPLPEVGALLDEAVRGNVIVDDDAHRRRFRFSEARVRDALYALPSAADRTRLHVAAARSLIAQRPVGTSTPFASSPRLQAALLSLSAGVESMAANDEAHVSR